MRNPEDVVINGMTLQEILERHEHWLKRDCPGWENMRAVLKDADLHDANLQGADLRDAILKNVNLKNANLKDANLESARLQNACLDHACLRGTRLSEAVMTGADLSYADLTDAGLQNADLRAARLCNAILNQTSLQHASLQHASLHKASIGGTMLQHAVMNGCDFHEASIYSTDFHDAVMDDTSLQGAFLFCTSLQNASLRNAGFRGSVLQYVDMSGADMRQTDMQDVVLKDTVLTNADLENAKNIDWKSYAGSKKEACLVDESDKVRIFSSGGIPCSHSFYSPEKGKEFPCTVVYNPLVKNITIAFADGGKSISAKKIMQGIFGPEAEGKNCIAETPEGLELDLDAARLVAGYINAEYMILGAYGRDGKLADIDLHLKAARTKKDIVSRLRWNSPCPAERESVSGDRPEKNPETKEI